MVTNAIIGPSLPPGGLPSSKRLDEPASACNDSCQLSNANPPLQNGGLRSSDSQRFSQHLKTVNCSTKLHHEELSSAWDDFLGVGCGLTNLGNTCYLNSVLQCLTHIPPLANLAWKHYHRKQCKLGLQDCTFCMLMLRISMNFTSSRPQDCKPLRICNSLRLVGKQFQRYRQEDAHELLRCMVEAWERDLLKHEGRWTGKHIKDPNTVVNQLFQGTLQSQVKCLSCGHESNTYDPFMDLSLELTHCGTLFEALQRFTAVEHLDGSNKYRCDKCKKLVAARKQITIHHDPNILVIHLKRFDGIYGGKITRHIQFPEVLSLFQYLSPETSAALRNGGSAEDAGANGSHSNGGVNGSADGSGCSSSSSNGYSGKNTYSSGNGGGMGSSSNGNGNCNSAAGGSISNPPQYRLQGVLVHQGYSSHSGHYFAYVRSSEENPRWYCKNDSIVNPVKPEAVLNQNAYMLFYVRTSMQPLRPVPPCTPDPSDTSCPPHAPTTPSPPAEVPLASASHDTGCNGHTLHTAANGHADSAGNGHFHPACTNGDMPHTAPSHHDLPPSANGHSHDSPANGRIHDTANGSSHSSVSPAAGHHGNGVGNGATVPPLYPKLIVNLRKNDPGRALPGASANSTHFAHPRAMALTAVGNGTGNGAPLLGHKRPPPSVLALTQDSVKEQTDEQRGQAVGAQVGSTTDKQWETAAEGERQRPPDAATGQGKQPEDKQQQRKQQHDGPSTTKVTGIEHGPPRSPATPLYTSLPQKRMSEEGGAEGRKRQAQPVAESTEPSSALGDGGRAGTAADVGAAAAALAIASHVPEGIAGRGSEKDMVEGGGERSASGEKNGGTGSGSREEDRAQEQRRGESGEKRKRSDAQEGGVEEGGAFKRIKQQLFAKLRQDPQYMSQLRSHFQGTLQQGTGFHAAKEAAGKTMRNVPNSVKAEGLQLLRPVIEAKVPPVRSAAKQK